MYHRNKYAVKIEKPFILICGNCGSHDVGVYANDRDEVAIRCNRCSSYLTDSMYNELKYKDISE